MNTAVKLLNFFLIVLLFHGCKTSNEVYYSYRMGTYTVDTVKKPLYYQNLISYGDYLFEFRNKINIHQTVHKDSFNLTAVSYDTTGVYLLSSSNNLYYEFDIFSLKNKVVEVGRLEDKPFGQKWKE